MCIEDSISSICGGAVVTHHQPLANSHAIYHITVLVDCDLRESVIV